MFDSGAFGAENGGSADEAEVDKAAEPDEVLESE
jgi:hypothetical protein